MRTKLISATGLLLIGIVIGSLIYGPAYVFGQASSGGAGALNRVTIPSLLLMDSATIPPLSMTERSTAPSSPVIGDLYIDDGTNCGGGAAACVRRYTGAGWETLGDGGAGGSFTGLSDTPSGYTTGNAIYTTNGTPDAVIETTVMLTEAANTFNLAKGTASLDIAAGATLNIDTNLTVNSAAVILNQSLQSSDSPTFADVTISTPSNIYTLSHDAFADFVGDEHVAHSGVDITAGDGLTGGGDISTTRTLTLGTPTTLTPSTTNSVSAGSHEHQVTGFVAEDGVWVQTPSSDQSLLAGTALTITNAVMRVVGNSGSVTITATPSITNPSSDGTRVLVQGTSDSNTVTYQDESDLSGSDLELANNQPFTLGKGDMLELTWDAGDDCFYEISRRDN